MDDLHAAKFSFLGSTQLSQSRIVQKKSSRSPTPLSPRTIIANWARESPSSPLSNLPDLDDLVVRERLLS